jgi:hypothetical protein
MKHSTTNSTTPADPGLSRRAFLTKASAVGAITLSPLSAFANAVQNEDEDDRSQLKEGDKSILIAAEIAEALAVTTYTNIINFAPFFPNIPDDDQAYLQAAR